MARKEDSKKQINLQLNHETKTMGYYGLLKKRGMKPSW